MGQVLRGEDPGRRRAHVGEDAGYHQYPAKGDIVLAAAELELSRLAAIVQQAEQEPTAQRALASAVDGIVELTIERRNAVGTFLNDPVARRHFAAHGAFRDVMARLRRLAVPRRTGERGPHRCGSAHRRDQRCRHPPVHR